MLKRRLVTATSVPRPSGFGRGGEHRPRRAAWLPCAAVLALMTLGSACASDSDNAPATTAGATATTISDPADGPQPNLKPGSNLPPDEEPSATSTPASAGNGTPQTSAGDPGTQNTGG